MRLTDLPGAQQEREPTELQLRIMSWVARFHAKRRMCPTFHELAAAFEVWPVTARTNAETLKRNTWVTWEERDRRTLRLTDAGEALLKEHEVRDV